MGKSRYQRTQGAFCKHEKRGDHTSRLSKFSCLVPCAPVTAVAFPALNRFRGQFEIGTLKGIDADMLAVIRAEFASAMNTFRDGCEGAPFESPCFPRPEEPLQRKCEVRWKLLCRLRWARQPWDAKHHTDQTRRRPTLQ